MKYAIEAYDVLVFKLKHDISKLEEQFDNECGTNSTIILGLLDYIAEKIDIASAIEIASKFDEKYPEEQLEKCVKDRWGIKYD